MPPSHQSLTFMAIASSLPSAAQDGSSVRPDRIDEPFDTSAERSKISPDTGAVISKQAGDEKNDDD